MIFIFLVKFHVINDSHLALIICNGTTLNVFEFVLRFRDHGIKMHQR